MRLKNIGPKSAEWLESVGIRTREDLSKLGAVEAYRRVKAAQPDRVSLNMLYALQGALLDIHWNHIAQEMRDELKRQLGE